MKRLLFIVIAICTLSISAFAYNSSFYTSPISVINGDWTYTITADDGVYFYFTESSSNYVLNFCSENNNASATYVRRNGGYTDNGSKTVNGVLDESVYRYKDWLNFPSSASFDPVITPFPEGTTDAEIETAFIDFLESPSTAIVSNFTLPRGNVLYFKVSENQDVHFESEFMSNSALFSSGTYGPWGDTQQRFGSVSTLPSSNTVFPLSSQSPITWYKSPNQNILGQTKTGRASISCVTGQYYCFYNPAFSYVSDTQERDSVGGTVHVNGSFSEIKIYPLSQQLTIENGQILMNSDSNDGYTSFFDGTVNENGSVTFIDQDGNIGIPVNGGQNQQDAPVTAQGLIESIKGTLQDILRETESLFTFGYEAIQNLVSTIADFTSVFSQLYTWLPSPVYQALISAIIIAITIGVFKVFL